MIATYGSIIFAFFAAVFWFWSAVVKIPKAIRHIDEGYFSDTQPKPIDDLDRLTLGLSFQSRLNAAGAICAGISVVLQSLTTFGF